MGKRPDRTARTARLRTTSGGRRQAATLVLAATLDATARAAGPIDTRLMRRARINTIVELPDRSGRMAVPDLNGMLYLVRNGRLGAYLDVGATFAPRGFSGRGLGRQ